MIGVTLLHLGKLGAKELKDLSQAVKDERERRSKRNPANHDAPTWAIPNEALMKSQVSAA